MFNLPKKQLENKVEIKINGKKLNQTHSVKHLGIHIQKNFTWTYHTNDVCIKLVNKTQFYPKEDTM